MDIAKIIEDNPWLLNIFYSLLTIIISVLIYIITTHIVMSRVENSKYKIFSGKKYSTYFKLAKSINRYLYAIIVLFIILKINGVNISAMIAGVGVFGIIFGFAIQDALKDVIKGIDIITDTYYRVGDVIRLDKYTGKVLAIGIKTTKIEDIFENNIVSISNRNIEKVEVLSHMINIDVPLPYELKIKESEDIMKYIVSEISKLDTVENVEYRGVNDLAESSIKHQIKVYCPPMDKVQTRRNSLTCIVRCLEEKDIQVPYNQLDIHQK